MNRWLACVVVVLLAACASVPSGTRERELTQADVKAVVAAQVGDVLVVRLAANASTGFAWAWDEPAAAGVLAQAGEPAMSGVDATRVGSGGTQAWRFRVVKPGDAQLRLEYRRPWEHGTPPAQTVSWQIQAR
jgi:inhibitor of cysteine peptidase